MNMFTFELLVHFVESLSIAHGDEKSLGKIFLFIFLLIYSLALLSKNLRFFFHFSKKACVAGTH